MYISNFQLIEKETLGIEFHLMDIFWTKSINNIAWIEFKVIQTKGNGSVETIYNTTRIQLNSQSALYKTYSNETDLTLFPLLSSNLVG